MTKREAVDQIFIAVNGGKMSADASVKRPEIEAYLGLALASAIQNALYNEKQQARADKGSGLIFEDAIPESFYSTYSFTPTLDTGRDAWTADLPKTIGLEYGWGVKHPRPKANAGEDFLRMPHSGIASAMSAAFFGARMYWTEEGTDSTTIFLKGMPTPVCEMVVSIIKDPKYIDDNDTIIAPKDSLNNAIRIATDYFRAQAGVPASERHDDKAPNEGE